MAVRSRSLPPGWYPGTRSQAENKVKSFLSSLPEAQDVLESKEGGAGVSGIVPHAGWDFSGTIALDVLCRLQRRAQTVVVVGGHLSPQDGIYAALEEGFETPLGNLPADKEMLSEIQSRERLLEDRHTDNTVEIQLPFVKFLYPEAKVLYLRAGVNAASVRLGEAIHEAAEHLNRTVVVVGSTDLTHYGAAYGFMPQGSGESAVRWVKEVNDKQIIDSFLAMDSRKALELAQRDRSACSAGGAAAAIAFARREGATQGVLVSYRTSWDVAPSPSFVGYAGVLYGG